MVLILKSTHFIITQHSTLWPLLLMRDNEILAENVARFSYSYWCIFSYICFVRRIVDCCSYLYKTAAQRHPNNDGKNARSSVTRRYCQTPFAWRKKSCQIVITGLRQDNLKTCQNATTVVENVQGIGRDARKGFRQTKERIILQWIQFQELRV